MDERTIVSMVWVDFEPVYDAEGNKIGETELEVPKLLVTFSDGTVEDWNA